MSARPIESRIRPSPNSAPNTPVTIGLRISAYGPLVISAIKAVIGGFHMMKAEEPPIDETIEWFAAEKIERLLPMHCVEFEYLTKFHAAFGMPKMGAGDLIEI